MMDFVAGFLTGQGILIIVIMFFTGASMVNETYDNTGAGQDKELKG